MAASTLESVAFEMFEQEYERESRETSSRRVRRTPIGNVEVCPVAWVMPELLKLMAENHAAPVASLRPAIRTLISEKAFAFGAQGVEPELAVEQEVDLIVRTLERVREYAFNAGQWSEMECTPEMFVG